MVKNKKKQYSTDDLKYILQTINGDLMRIILTEHYLQKLEHRHIDEILIDKKLLEEEPIDIKRVSHSPDDFTLTFKSDEGNISVVVKIFNSNSLILISAVVGD
ncbi:hypothetical protein [Methanobrevibacter sp.]|uniref:hypothetical protein n=1 Tax=Methanobrevibacter sp. TaxID=66852 RepID=UPI00388F1AF6